MEFTCKEALDFSQRGEIDKWVHEFLTSVGKNNHLSEIMKEKGHFYGPVDIPFSKLIRCCGPEKNMKFYEFKDKWEDRNNSMIKAIKNEWNVPPFIVWCRKGKLSIADGNHRIEALKKCGFKKYWVIIWFKKLEDLKKFKINFR